MSHSTAAPVPAIEVPSIPLAELAPWALFSALLAGLVVYFIGADQGALSLLSGTGVHEFVHDGRHLLGYPCH